ncbi:hypothetical protein SAMN05421881_10303 [Nitrosomonas halophila]|uniref:Uncharacterized protein n=2 Tax=Nitrosomonas halophila TaxID=44576 RepID=A0A1H3J270_9PROT|nr:hypothetical protein SAMN05421881_10303 [Nitrosomonas halophila]
MERGNVRTLRLAGTLFEVVIDDTLIPRQSEKPPGSAIAGRKCMLPIVSRSVPATGNRNKRTIALVLVRSLAPVMMNKHVRLLYVTARMTQGWGLDV